MTLQEWLDVVNENFKRPSAAMDMRSYIGTEVQLQMPIAVWNKNTHIRHTSLNLADLTLPAAHAEHARDLVEATLKSISESPTPALITVNAPHILSVLYSGGITQPLSRFLRTGRFAVLMTVPRNQDWHLPDGAIVSDWRSLLFQSAPLL